MAATGGTARATADMTIAATLETRWTHDQAITIRNKHVPIKIRYGRRPGTRTVYPLQKIGTSHHSLRRASDHDTPVRFGVSWSHALRSGEGFWRPTPGRLTRPASCRSGLRLC